MSEQVAEIALTPTEDLVVEVLVARHRLGESHWTFDARHKRAIESLDSKGLVVPMSGTIERTVRAYLTIEGVTRYVSPRYVPPVLQAADGLLSKALDIGDRYGRYGHEWVDAINRVRGALGGRPG